MLETFIEAFSLAVTFQVIVYTVIGIFLGLTVGAIPGLSGDMAIAILLPFVFVIEPSAALGMLVGVYKGSMLGGSISAISFGVPGTAGAAATTLDGYQAKLNGQPNRALKTSLYSSVIGDTTSDLVLIFLSLPLAAIALMFGPVEFFALYVFAFMLISTLTEGKLAKGFAAAALGIFVALIGRDPIVGSLRLTFGIPYLSGGVGLIPLLVGIFALSELMIQFARAWHQKAKNKMTGVAEQAQILGYDATKDRMSFQVFRSTLRATFIGTGVGTFVGALPGAGSSLAAFLSYGLAQRFSRYPSRFGKGSLEGVAAPEAANSATAGATFIPLFAFGIPGSATAALFAAALIMQGITPGPTMLDENRVIIFALFITLLYANPFTLLFGHLLIPIYSRLSMINTTYLLPTVFMLAVLGTYAVNNSVVDVWILIAAGLLGLVLRINGFPLGPLVLGFIVAPGAERALRQSLLLGRDDWGSLLSSPIAIGFYLAAAIFIVVFAFAMKKPEGEEV